MRLNKLTVKKGEMRFHPREENKNIVHGGVTRDNIFFCLTGE